MPRRSRKSRYVTPSLSAPIRLWILRLLRSLNCEKEFISHHNGLGNLDLAVALGLPIAGEDDCAGQIDVGEIQRTLRNLHQQAEKNPLEHEIPACLKTNVERLSDIAGLSDAEARILEFAVLIQSERLLEATSDWLGFVSTSRSIHILSVLLDLAPDDIRASISPQSALSRSGLLVLNRCNSATLSTKLILLSEEFSDCICSSEADPISLLRNMVIPGKSPELSLEDYPHLSPWITALFPYLRNTLSSGRRGVNILLHGVPGTGKSQLARVLAQQLSCELFEVSSEDGNGDPIQRLLRLMAFRCAQSFLAQRRSLIQFDEIEDIFEDRSSFSGQRRSAQNQKGWINRMLEDNPVPTLWISNSIAGIDNSIIRRFDMIIDLPVPPKRQREKIITRACEDLADERLVRLLADSESLSPAVVARAATVVRTIKNDLGDQCAATLGRLISSTLEAQGHAPIRGNNPTQLPEFYDPRFVNADTDLLEVANGLSHSRSGRACLYGPPGTGKTAYGRWLADYLDVPLIIRRASDLMSKWVGENERNIANAFRQAEQENAILLIDEVDSFLQDRRQSHRSWEVSLVNELLTQMEDFPGIFIASTNLMTALDPAALRRFDLKIKFDFMNSAQSQALLEKHCERLHLPPPSAAETGRIRRLDNLTPGDFAAVLRQHRLRPLISANDLIRALEGECALKEGHKSAIGFV